MKVSHFNLVVVVVPMCLVIILFVSCGKVPNNITGDETGSMEVQIQLLQGLGKRSAQQATEFDSLIIEVDGEDIEKIRYTQPIVSQNQFIIDTLTRIPAGNERTIKVQTINKNGDVIHEDSSGIRKMRIESNMTTVLQVVLIPIRGSIYLQIGDVPTDVDSLVAIFTSNNNQEWIVKVPRKPKVYASIDGILHNTKGILIVAGLSNNGDTLYSAQTEITVDAKSNNSIQLDFSATPVSFVLSATLQRPGVIVASGSMGGASSTVDTEQGELFITEIMYAANDSEYIEVFNPKSDQAHFDTLFIELDGKSRLFTNITIEPKSYFVFGRRQLPWVDVAHSTVSALDLSSNGNWITVLSKTGTVIDQVIFTGGTNDLEWPRVSGKSSICLIDQYYNSSENNYGNRWISATVEISGAPGQFGTPHAK